MIYNNNEQLIIEIKKLLLDKQVSQREIAEALGIKPQGLTKILNKKNFSFDDANKILSIINCNLVIEFKDKTEIWISVFLLHNLIIQF